MCKETKVTSFKIGLDEEITVEDMLMGLAMAESVFQDQQKYIELMESNGGQAPDNQIPPDPWAVIGALQVLGNVSHALKCGCWGYKEAYNH
jgi:hypothetical protein